MKRKLLIILVTIISLQLNANVGESESSTYEVENEIQKILDASDESIRILNQMLRSAEKEKKISSQLIILDKLAKVLNSAGQLDKAKSSAEKLLSIADDNKIIEYQIKALVTLSQIAKTRGDYKTAAEILEQKVIPLAQNNALDSLPEHFRLLGVYKRNLGLYSEAESNYSKALAEFLERDDELGAGKTYSALGVLFESRGELKDAFENHLKARVIFEKYNDIDQLATNYFNLGEMYRRTSEPNKALELFKRALDMDIKRNNKSDMAYSYTKVASMLEYQGKIEEALNHSEKSISLFQELGDNRMLSWSLPLYARLNKKLGNMQGYYQALKLTENTVLQSGSKVQLRNVYQMLALHHYNTGDIELARKQIELAMQAMQGLDQDVITHDVHSVFAKILAAQGEYEKAFDQLKMTHKLYMELNENEHADAQEKYKKDINLLEEKFRVSELEQKNLLQQKELEQEKFERNMIFTTSAAILIIILMFAYVQFNRRKLAVYKSDLIVESLDKKNAY
ncbi:MAG: tetratricopeptide repeat protein, partial [Kangiellaceae bacterium]|nr:tetratricopeptide repeat protein [Kangiellaceae bacterium]